MDITDLKNQLQAVIPDELYDISPGQIVLFVPEDGITLSSIGHMAFFNYLVEDILVKRLKLKEAKLSIVTTGNSLLIDCFAERTQDAIGNPYKVIVSPERYCGGLIAEYFGIGKEVLTTEAGLPNEYFFEDPIILYLDPRNRPVKKMCTSCPYLDNGDGSFNTELLQARPAPGSKEEKRLIKKEEDKLYALLRECYVLDLPLDIDKVKMKFDAAVNSDIDYQLIIKGGFHRDGRRIICDFCDIFVADDEKHKLDLTAIEKAVYLTFLLYPQGIRIKETFWGFRETCMKIYGALPFDERCEKTVGLRNDPNALPDVYEKTLRGYLSTIRTEVAKKVSNPKTAIEFAIEGYKDLEFGVSRSTPEIRAQIKDYFGV